MSLKLAMHLLDLVLTFFMTNNTPTFFDLALITIFVIKIKISTMVYWEPDLRVAPSKFINALLQSTPAPHGDRCPICFDHPFMPRKISCNHVFCRDCAFLTFAKRDSCPICLRVPKQLHDIELAIPVEDLVESWINWIFHGVRTATIWHIGWIVSCAWQLRFALRSEIMLAVMRTSTEIALQAALVDILPCIPRFHLRSKQRTSLATVVATASTLVLTLSYNYVAFSFLALLVVEIARQVREVIA